MRNQAQTRPRVKLVLGRGKAIVSLALLVVIVLSTVALAGLHTAIESARAKEADNRAAALRLEQENNRLENRIDKLGTAESVRDIAREELGLEDPDTVVLIMEDAE